MKIVLDTNIYISAFHFKGICSEVIDLCSIQYEIFISDNIFQEIKKVLETKFNYSENEFENIIYILDKITEKLKPTNNLPSICRDKDDNHILQLADFINADYIITGDKDLLILEKYLQTKIITPKDFIISYYKNFDTNL